MSASTSSSHSLSAAGIVAGIGKTQSPISMPMIHHHHQHNHHAQQAAIPSSAAAAAAAAAVAAATQLAAAAAAASGGGGSRLLQAPQSASSPQPLSTLPHQQQQQQHQPQLPSWAYGHPALLPVDPQTESIAENWRQFQQAALNYNLDPHMLAAMYGGGGGVGGGGGIMPGGGPHLGFSQHPLHPHHPHHHPHHQHPHAQLPHQHRGDLTARRKNATRETTSILKAWLNEHKKNPYPTKGEKIMLAIITTMTLTQVSTWFANARRRLKKENKMTWVPRNRPDEEDDEEEDDEIDAHVGPTSQLAEANSGAATTAIDIVDNNEDFDYDEDEDNDELRRTPIIPSQAQEFINHQRKRPIEHQLDGESAAKATSDEPAAKAKPRIWSIVDTLNKTETTKPQAPPPPPPHPLPLPLPMPMPHHQHHQSALALFSQHSRQCGVSLPQPPPPPPPPPPHHQLLLPPPLYYSLFNAFNNRPTLATSTAAASFSGREQLSPEQKPSPTSALEHRVEN